MTGTGERDVRPLAVLLVCTGNVARSPVAEHLLRAGLPPQSGVRWASAGTRAVVGAPVVPAAARLLEDRVDMSSFRARRLDASLVRSADLVVCLAREHRSAVVSLVPAALRHTVTLLELERAGREAQGPGSCSAWAAAVETTARAAVWARGARPRSADDDDVPDPLGGPDGSLEQCVRRIDSAVASLTASWSRLLAPAGVAG